MLTSNRHNPIFLSNMRTATLDKKPRTQEVIPAPKWLARRMETLQRMPPPTLIEVEKHFKASMEARKRLNGNRAI